MSSISMTLKSDLQSLVERNRTVLNQLRDVLWRIRSNSLHVDDDKRLKYMCVYSTTKAEILNTSR